MTPRQLLEEVLRALNSQPRFHFIDTTGERRDSYELAALIGEEMPTTDLPGILTTLDEVEQHLAEMVVDAQDAAEEQGIFSAGFFTGDNDDIPICVPEDAAPELDGARHNVWEAAQTLREYLKSKERPAYNSPVTGETA